MFRAPGFPSVDAPPIDDASLRRATANGPVTLSTSVDELEAWLPGHPFDVLVLPYGSAFPVDAWPAIRSFVRGGGSLVNLGGAPFGQPVYRDHDAWRLGPASPAFQHELLIGPAEPIVQRDGTTTWALTVRLTREKDFPDEHGSAGPSDATIQGSELVNDDNGTPRGCELLQIDRTRGPEAGARWKFATTNRRLTINEIGDAIMQALAGAAMIRAYPRRATIDVGDRIDMAVTSDRPFKTILVDAAASKLFPPTAPLTKPGLYDVIVEYEDPMAGGVDTGVWVRDKALLTNGPHITVGRDWLRKDGKTFPIVGTTYMASDVHRHFLFEPNPSLWDADFAAMQKHGINFVRTGIWTAWSQVMKDGVSRRRRALRGGGLRRDGRAARYRRVLQPLCVLAADLRRDESVCGSTRGRRPKSIGDRVREALRRGSVGALGSHQREPSYAPRPKLWSSTKPIGDLTEETAWRAWVDKRHHHPSRGELAALWRDASDNPLAIPVDDDFERAPVQVGRHPRKARDFREFSEEAVASWAGQLRDALKRAGGDALVTLGQDEGGIYERATQQFLAPSLDYTAVHTWWKNDDLLWDGVLTKVVGKPFAPLARDRSHAPRAHRRNAVAHARSGGQAPRAQIGICLRGTRRRASSNGCGTSIPTCQSTKRPRLASSDRTAPPNPSSTRSSATPASSRRQRRISPISSPMLSYC